LTVVKVKYLNILTPSTFRVFKYIR